MPSAHTLKSAKEAFARQKALHTLVYISGLAGQHSLEVGLAYYYRGHYIYACPAGNLIEPIPYSTRKGIMIQGIVSESAPGYDGSALGLGEEREIRALEKSVESERRAKGNTEQIRLAETEDALTLSQLEAHNVKEGSGGDAGKLYNCPVSPALRLTPPSEDLRRSLASLAALRDSEVKTSTPRYGLAFCAASAPGSRLASRSASPSGLRPISSHVGLARLGAIRGQTSPFERDYFEANPPIEDVPSRDSSTVGYLHGLGDHALSEKDLPRPGGVRIAPCPIHGEECDGVSVEGPWLTEQIKRGMGFVWEAPMIERGGRQMVDWMGLMLQAKAGVTE